MQFKLSLGTTTVLLSLCSCVANKIHPQHHQSYNDHFNTFDLDKGNKKNKNSLPSILKRSITKRGGATTPPRRPHFLEENFSVTSYAKAVSNDKRSLPWSICLVLSIIYAVAFVGGNPISKFLKEGFCVTGLQAPDFEQCSIPTNSHFYAFSVDVLYTVGSIWLAFFSGLSDKSLPTKIAIPFIIIVHGLLHGLYSLPRFKCSLPLSFGPGPYNIFVAALTAIIFLLYSSISVLRSILFWIPLFTIITIQITTDPNIQEKKFSTIFMITHLLLSFVSVFHPKEGTSDLTGWLFIAPVVVSLLEFLDCDFLVKYGGHVWYDLTLHLSVVSALLKVQD